MNHNLHAIDYYARLYWSLEEQGRYWAMAVVYQLHFNELKAAGIVMSTSTLQPLLRQIFDIALRLSECGGPAVAVEYNSHSHHLRVHAKSDWQDAPLVHECIDLYRPEATPFEKKRVDDKLHSLLTHLNAMLVSAAPSLSPAS